MGLMIRLLLAVLLACLSLSAPVNAVCSYESPSAQPCCCSAPVDVSCFQVEQPCCCAADRAPALPVQNQSKTLAAPIALSVPTISLAPIVFDQRASETRLSKPLHLASNKIYLLKRTLLI